MCIMCVEIIKGRMKFNEVTRAMGEFKVEPEHEKELEKVILENFSIKDVAEGLGIELEEAAEAFGELDLRQFGDVYNV